MCGVCVKGELATMLGIKKKITKTVSGGRKYSVTSKGPAFKTWKYQK